MSKHEEPFRSYWLPEDCACRGDGCPTCTEVDDGQAPVASEDPDRTLTAPEGVPVTMAELVGGCLR